MYGNLSASLTAICRVKAVVSIKHLSWDYKVLCTSIDLTTVVVQIKNLEMEIKIKEVLVTDGLKWLLRFVGAHVDGAASVGQVHKNAIDGVQLKRCKNKGAPLWAIDDHLQSTIHDILDNLPDSNDEASKSGVGQEKVSQKNR
jgi:hypothetical protein